MERRQLLAATGTTLGVGLAGCSSVTGEKELGEPTEETDPDGRAKDLVFEHDGEVVTTISLRQRTLPQPPTNQYGLRITISHTDDTRIKEIQFDLRSPPVSPTPPADIYLKQPEGGPWPEVEFQAVENQWTRIAVDSLGSLGQGTVSLDTIVAPTGDSIETVGIRADVLLGTTGLLSGGPFSVDSQVSFDPVAD